MKSNTATWNREDRDLLVELRTTMNGMNGEIAKLHYEVKEINTGITARILNLESNAVSKIEINPRLEKLEERTTSLEDGKIEFRAATKTWGIVIAGALAMFEFLTTVYFHYH